MKTIKPLLIVIAILALMALVLAAEMLNSGGLLGLQYQDTWGRAPHQKLAAGESGQIIYFKPDCYYDIYAIRVLATGQVDQGRLSFAVCYGSYPCEPTVTVGPGKFQQYFVAGYRCFNDHTIRALWDGPVSARYTLSWQSLYAWDHYPYVPGLFMLLLSAALFLYAGRYRTGWLGGLAWLAVALPKVAFAILTNPATLNDPQHLAWKSSLLPALPAYLLQMLAIGLFCGGLDLWAAWLVLRRAPGAASLPRQATFFGAGFAAGELLAGGCTSLLLAVQLLQENGESWIPIPTPDAILRASIPTAGATLIIFELVIIMIHVSAAQLLGLGIQLAKQRVLYSAVIFKVATVALVAGIKMQGSSDLLFPFLAITAFLVIDTWLYTSRQMKHLPVEQALP